jgi:eukaryotic-like serine/threonine-protein kinase
VNETHIIILSVRGFLRLLWMALLLVTVALVSALVTMRLAVHGREVEVPDVHGKTPGEASHLAEDRGLSTQIERQYYSATVPEGRVLSQVPEAGSVVRRGWELRLALSLGPQRVTIPQMVGQSERAATIVSQQRGLDNEVAEVDLPGATAGQVIGQDPPANAVDVAAPKVNLLVAQEVSPESYAMPGFVGRPLASAVLAIRDAGFSLGKVTVAPPAGVASNASIFSNPAGSNPKPPTNDTSSAPNSFQSALGVVPSPAAIIISQDPAPGRRVAAGSEIRFIVR